MKESLGVSRCFPVCGIWWSKGFVRWAGWRRRSPTISPTIALQIYSGGLQGVTSPGSPRHFLALDQSYFWVVKSPVQVNGKTSMSMKSILLASYWDHSVHVCVDVGAHVCAYVCVHAQDTTLTSWLLHLLLPLSFLTARTAFDSRDVDL